MKKWTSDNKGDIKYSREAITLYGGTESYIKNKYLRIIKQRMKTLKMKTYFKTYTQIY